MKVGDIVRFKSGGPIMTVVEVLNGGSVNCRWYSGKDDVYKDQQFDVACLIAAL